MAITLHSLQHAQGEKKRSRRVGRGNGSGRGTYSGRGLKGQKARSGGTKGLTQRSLKQQLFSKLPKFKSFLSNQAKHAVVNLGALDKVFPEGEFITPKKLFKAGLLSANHGRIKVLSDGGIHKKFTIKAHGFSEKALRDIVNAGGRAQVIGTKAQTGDGNMAKKKSTRTEKQ